MARESHKCGGLQSRTVLCHVAAWRQASTCRFIGQACRPITGPFTRVEQETGPRIRDNPKVNNRSDENDNGDDT